jgi:L-ascorbate metabolism protein UlaG (beta-lactamase superfamily)
LSRDGGPRKTVKWSLVPALVAVSLAVAGVTAASAQAERVTITWFGHSLFRIEFEGGPTVLTDPFEPGLWGMTYPIGPMDGVDVVTITHEHEDHNYAALAVGSPVVLRGVSVTSGVNEIDTTINGIRFYTVSTCHSPGVPCPTANANAAIVIEGIGLRIAHLGDLGHVLDGDEAAAIGKLDVLLIPVGGGGATIDASAADVVIALLEPSVIIGMHYETPELGWGIDAIDPFLNGKTVMEVAERSLTVSAGALPESSTVFVLRYE